MVSPDNPWARYAENSRTKLPNEKFSLSIEAAKQSENDKAGFE